MNIEQIKFFGEVFARNERKYDSRMSKVLPANVFWVKGNFVFPKTLEMAMLFQGSKIISVAGNILDERSNEQTVLMRPFNDSLEIFDICLDKRPDTLYIADFGNSTLMSQDRKLFWMSVTESWKPVYKPTIIGVQKTQMTS